MGLYTSKLIFVFTLFMSVSALADLEFVGDTIQIGHDLYSGPTLIYNCKGKNYACVDDDGVKDCEYKRAEAKKFFKSNLECAVFKRFDTIKSCQAYQQKKVNNPDGKSYCVHKEKKRGTTH